MGDLALTQCNLVLKSDADLSALVGCGKTLRNGKGGPGRATSRKDRRRAAVRSGAVPDGVAKAVNRVKETKSTTAWARRRRYVAVLNSIAFHLHLHSFTFIYIHLHSFTSTFIHLHSFRCIYMHLHEFTTKGVARAPADEIWI